MPFGSKLGDAWGLQTNYVFLDGNLEVGTVANPISGLKVRYVPTAGYEDENYKSVDDVDLIVVVIKAEAHIDTSGVITRYTYTGYEQEVASGATITNTEQTIIYSNNKFTTVAEGNGRVVEIWVAETANCLAESKTVTLSVDRAQPILDVSNVPTVYTYNREQQTVTGATINNSEQIISETENTFVTVAQGRAIGKVRFSVETSANYYGKMVEVEFVVNKDTQIIDTSVAERGYEYTGFRQYVTARINDNEQTLLYSANSFITVKEGNGMRIAIRAAETANYNAIYKEITIVVRKRLPMAEKQVVYAYYGQILNDVKGSLPQYYEFEQQLNTKVGTPNTPAAVSLVYITPDPENEDNLHDIECELIVSKRDVTIRALDVDVIYGEEGYADRPLEYVVEGKGIVQGDDLGINLARREGDVADTYEIVVTADNDLYIKNDFKKISKPPLRRATNSCVFFFYQDICKPPSRRAT